MNTGSHQIVKKLFALALVAVALSLAAFAATASASRGSSTICSLCHTGVGAAPTVTITSAPGADPVTYSVHQPATAWAAFDLTDGFSKIAGGAPSDATFTAPLGHYVRVCWSDGYRTGTFTQAYVIRPAAKAHGWISPVTDQVVAPGGSQTFTITVDPGYHIADVKIDGASNAAAVAAGSYTFTNVQADGTIEATFAADVTNFTITATAGLHGRIDPAGAVSVAQGTSQTFTVTPDVGCLVGRVLVDNAAAQLTSGKYTFTSVTANHTIAVTFVQKSTVTLSLSGLRSGVLRLGRSVTAKGVVKPVRAGTAKITVQRKVSGTWRTLTTKARTLNATSGAYSWTYKPTRKGAYRMHTTVAKTTLYTAATSPWRTFTVK